MTRTLLLLAAAAALAASPALAADPSGLWRTEATEEGDFLVVEIKPCGDRICGEIVSAGNVSGATSDTYEHIGRNIVTGMAPDGENKWDDGEIWDPTEDKTYSSEMELKGDVLTVEGCVLVFCRGQDWTRAE